jgi:beta-galactosidase/beta-glucuronidase
MCPTSRRHRCLRVGQCLDTSRRSTNASRDQRVKASIYVASGFLHSGAIDAYFCTLNGVWSSAEVWLNGEALGRHDSGFTKISFDISPALKAGAENLLAVRVRQVQQDYLFDTNDDWTMGGIYRDVSLEIMPKLRWLDRIEIQTDFDDEYWDADLNVRVMVGDLHKRVPPGNVDEPYALRLSLFDAAGKKVARQKIAVEGHSGTGREIRTSLRVRAPRHWTAETPNLYRLEVELSRQPRPRIRARCASAFVRSPRLAVYCASMARQSSCEA